MRTVLAPEADDPDGVEFYPMAVHRYHDYHLALLYMLYCDPAHPFIRKWGYMDTQLAVSRDGVAWQRLGGHQPLIARGPQGSFDGGMVGPNVGLIEREGKLWLFYNGWNDEHNATKAYRRANDPAPFADGRQACGMGLATLRQEGFISLDAGEEPGTLTLHPRALAGDTLAVNTRTLGDGGELRAELRDDAGRPLPGYALADSDRVRGDHLRHPLTWHNRTTRALPPGRYTLTLHLRLAELYAVAVTRE